MKFLRALIYIFQKIRINNLRGGVSEVRLKKKRRIKMLFAKFWKLINQYLKNRHLGRFNEFQFLFILEWTNKAKQWSRIFRNLCF